MSEQVKQIGHHIEMKLTTYIILDKWDAEIQMRVSMQNPHLSTTFTRNEPVNFNNPGISNDDLLDIAMKSLWNDIQEHMRETLIELKAYPKDMVSLNTWRSDG